MKMKTLTVTAMKMIKRYEVVLSIMTKLFTWFANNYSKPNPEKIHLCLSFKTEIKVYFSRTFVESCSAENLLRTQLGFDLTFDVQISSTFYKVSKRINLPSFVNNFFKALRFVVQRYLFINWNIILINKFIENVE